MPKLCGMQRSLPFEGGIRFEADWDPMDFMADPLDDFSPDELSLYKTDPQREARA